MSATSVDAVKRISQAVQAAPSAACYRVALSGGLDSVVLLKACHDAGLEPLEAIHVHHGLNEQADRWAEHCNDVCRDLSIPLIIKKVQVVPTGQGLEAAAREARYAAFEATMRRGDVLMMAHHADDQLETLLLRLCKGGQPEELAGIPGERPLGQGRLVRPFLEIEREALRQYAQIQGLSWVEDDSNQDTRFDRNFLRHAIVPLLKQRWPDLPARMNGLAARQSELVHSARLAEQGFLASCPPGQPLSLAQWLAVPVEVQARFMAAWLIRETGDRPPSPQLRQLVRQLRAGRNVCLPLNGVSLRSWRGALHAVPETDISLGNLSGEWPLELIAGQDGTLELPTGVLCWKWQAEGAQIPEDESSGWTCRYRRAGDKARFGRHRSEKPLKLWFQAQGIPEWVRAGTPLLLQNGRIRLWGDTALCPDASAGGRAGWCVKWTPKAHESG
ncbi:MAG: tRNA lysidine(34) synthetase TilS [Gammaproteobacteria bacterium]|nr:MAG: tRNA lysidine(34) synthetase TilS [Gammaproteobacteria bacterium]